MQIYSKYFIKILFIQFIAILVTLTGIVWITQSMRIVDLIVNKGISFADFFNISILLIPYIVFIITPVALFFSSMFTIYRFIADKEIIILKSSGLSNLQLLKPVIYFSFCVLVFTYIISFYLLPYSYGKFKDLQVYFRQNYASILLEEGVFSTQVRNFTVYVDKKVNDTTYRGIMVYDNRQEHKPKVVFAEEGKIIKSLGHSWFELYNGSHQEISTSGKGISVLYFDKYAISLNIFEADYMRTTEPNEKYINELFDDSLGDESKKKKWNLHGHFRISWPLNTLALGLLAASTLIVREYRRKEKFYKNLLLGMMGIIIIIVYMLFNNYAMRNQKLVFFLYLVPFLTLVYSVLTVIDKKK